MTRLDYIAQAETARAELLRTAEIMHGFGHTTASSRWNACISKMQSATLRLARAERKLNSSKVNKFA